MMMVGCGCVEMCHVCVLGLMGKPVPLSGPSARLVDPKSGSRQPMATLMDITCIIHKNHHYELGCPCWVTTCMEMVDDGVCLRGGGPFRDLRPMWAQITSFGPSGH